MPPRELILCLFPMYLKFQVNLAQVSLIPRKISKFAVLWNPLIFREFPYFKCFPQFNTFELLSHLSIMLS